MTIPTATPTKTNDERIAELARATEAFLRDCEAVGFDSDPIPKLVTTCRTLLAAVVTLQERNAERETIYKSQIEAGAKRIAAAEQRVTRLEAALEQAVTIITDDRQGLLETAKRPLHYEDEYILRRYDEFLKSAATAQREDRNG